MTGLTERAQEDPPARHGFTLKLLVRILTDIFRLACRGFRMGEVMSEIRTSQTSALRRSVDCLPTRTRQAMLVGIANNTIVVGAYAHNDGICPMLAAHRNGGRTDFVAFARAWDEFCFRGVRPRKRRPRLATASELTTLKAHIESSLLADEQVDLAGALADHRQLVDDRATRAPEVDSAGEDSAAEPVRTGGRVRDPDRVRPGDLDRSKELGHRHGWRWLRITRSLDEFEQALAELDESAAADLDPTAPETETVGLHG
jgi:hypothetical protein